MEGRTKAASPYSSVGNMYALYCRRETLDPMFSLVVFTLLFAVMALPLTVLRHMDFLGRYSKRFAIEHQVRLIRVWMWIVINKLTVRILIMGPPPQYNQKGYQKSTKKAWGNS